jgi:hypothetical protein
VKTLIEAGRPFLEDLHIFLSRLLSPPLRLHCYSWHCFHSLRNLMSSGTHLFPSSLAHEVLALEKLQGQLSFDRAHCALPYFACLKAGS